MCFFFSTYNNYFKCSLYFLFKHIGYITSIMILYIHIFLGYELGTVNLSDEKFKIVSSFSVNSLSGSASNSNIGSLTDMNDNKVSKNGIDKLKMSNKEYEISKSNILSKNNSSSGISHIISSTDINNINNKIETSHSFVDINSNNKNEQNSLVNNSNNNFNTESNALHNAHVYESFYSNGQVNIYKSNNSSDVNLQSKNIPNYNIIFNSIFQINEDDKSKKSIVKRKKTLKRNIENVHKIFAETIVVYPIFIIFTIFISILYKYLENNNENLTIVQSNNGQWYYKCNLETADTIYSSIELLILILIMIKGKTVLLYEGVFKCNKYIVYSSSVGIVFGPLANVNIIYLFILYIYIYYIYLL